MPAPNRQKSPWVLVGEYTSLGIMLPATTLVGYGMGYLLDRFFGTTFLRIVFLVLGIAGGFLQVIRQVQKDTQDRDDG